MSKKGHNNPPIELSREHAEIVLDTLERNMGQGLALLSMGGNEATLRKVVGMMEHIRPVRDHLKGELK